MGMWLGRFFVQFHEATTNATTTYTLVLVYHESLPEPSMSCALLIIADPGWLHRLISARDLDIATSSWTIYIAGASGFSLNFHAVLSLRTK
jgi:hypothetical protein